MFVHNNRKYFYAGLAEDILRKSHINIIKLTSVYEKVIFDFITNRATETYKKFPYLSYERRY